MSRLIVAFTAALVAAFAGWPRPASAYRCSRVGAQHGPSLMWEVRHLEWRLDDKLTADIPDRAQVEAAVVAGYRAWTDADCSDLVLAYGGLGAALKAEAKREGPNQNVLVFVSKAWSYDPQVIAVTTNAYEPGTGVIYDSDIEMNDEHFEFVIAGSSCDPVSNRMDLQNTVTHEVGHLLGLDHPPNTKEYEATTMFASAPPCETEKRSLAPDDTNGLCSIYPAGAPTKQCFLPDGPSFMVVSQDDGFGCRATPSDGRGPLTPGLAVLALLFLRRRGSASGRSAPKADS